VFDVQHRQALDRADGGAVAGHVDQRAGHDQVDLVAFQLPGQAAQGGPVDLGAGEHHDGVRVGQADRAGHVVEGAVDGRHAGARPAVLAGWQARADDAQPVVALVAQPPGHVGHRPGVPDQDDPVQPLAAGPGPVQQLPVDVAGAQVEQRGQRDGDNHVTAGQPQVERKGKNGQRRGQSQPGTDHPGVFVGADEQMPGLVGPVDGQSGDPGQREQQRQQPVVQQERLRPGCAEPQHQSRGRGQETDHPVDGTQAQRIAAAPAGLGCGAAGIRAPVGPEVRFLRSDPDMGSWVDRLHALPPSSTAANHGPFLPAPEGRPCDASLR
jgi:hypothetical protein